MAILSKDRNHGRQWALVAMQDFELSQLEDGVAVAAVKLPYGARVTGGGVIITEVFDSTTSDALDIGDGDDADRYSSTPIDGQALGYTALDITGFKYSTIDYVDITWASGGGTPTTGKGVLIVEYLVDGKANEQVPDYD
jgi:hypothetical protein